MAKEQRNQIVDLDGMNPASKDATLGTKVDQIITLLNEVKTIFNAHTHKADGAQAGAYNTSKPQSDAETVAPGTASPITSPSVNALKKS